APICTAMTIPPYGPPKAPPPASCTARLTTPSPRLMPSGSASPVGRSCTASPASGSEATWRSSATTRSARRGRWRRCSSRPAGGRRARDAPVILRLRPIGCQALPFPAVELGALQDLMDRTYGGRDRERGVTATVAWLAEEMGELARAVRKGTRDDQSHELGDVLAWVASLANQLRIDLHRAVSRYADGCPKCGGNPCGC